MTQLDYAKIGLIAGIEIHQQLEGKKLFCDSPTLIREDNPHFEITRRLKAVIGETGEIDTAAAQAAKKNKIFVYQGYQDTTGLVELDEEPPHLMNQGALELAAQLCILTKSKVIDEVQVMRKTVVDGSNTSGFQRTALVGYDGKITITSGKEISIPNIMIEEDAAKIVERTAEKDTYNISRLGIPLIEVSTGPDLKNPLEVKEAAEKLGMLLRSLQATKGQSVKRGLGTIRQDVNVSVKGGNRVEIKGAQDLKMMTTLVEFEAHRQLQLITLQKNEYVKKVAFSNIIDVTEILKNTACPFVKKTIDNGGIVLGMSVKSFEGIFGIEVCPGRRVGSEISDYAKQAGVGGLIHSDEDLSKKYKFSDTEIAELKKDLNVKKGDAFLLIADFDTKPQHALEFAKERITLLQKGVLKEVRKANPDGTTSFMRPMPGGARMYPETDTLPITLDISKITVGKTIEETAQELLSLGVKNPDIALTLAKEYKDIFEALLKQIPNIDANVLATNIVSWASKFPELITIEKQEDIVLILKAMTAGDIAMNAGESVLEELVKDVPIKKALEKHQTLPKAEVEKIIDDVLKTLSDDDKKKFGLVMGRVMAASKGKANGKVVTDILKKKL